MGRTIRGVKKEREAERKRRSDRQFTSDKTEAEYEIEKIVDSKSVAGGGTLYFVKWKVWYILFSVFSEPKICSGLPWFW